MNRSLFFPTFAVLAMSTALSASAQVAGTPAEPHSLRTFHLQYATTQNEQNEIMATIRNMVSPFTKVFLAQSTNEVAVNASAEDIRIVEELLSKVDVPRKLYRLTYTFTETDNGKRVGLQHYSMLLSPSQRMQMKEGSRIPVVTGTIGVDDPKPLKQNSYLDIGLNFDSQVDTYGPNGVRLRSKVEQSSVADGLSKGLEDPVIRQSVIEGNTVLTEGRAQTLGSLDLVDSTRHLEVEAMVEVVR